MIDLKTFNHYLNEYKTYVLSKAWEKELFKWRAVKTFQDNFDIDSSDFKEMLMASLSETDVLLTSHNFFAKGMIQNYAEKDPEKTRQAFKTLFNEDLNLYDRIDQFKQFSEEMREEHQKSSYQNENSISTYLWLRYPTKYFIYKFTEAKRVSELLNNDIQIKRGNYEDNILSAFSLYNELKELLKANNELVKLIQSRLSQSGYSAIEFNTVVVDFVHFLSLENGTQNTNNEVEEPHIKVNYYWLNANPSIWSWSIPKVGEECHYDKYNENGNLRRIAHYFDEVRPGDIIIGYEATPTKKIFALAEVTRIPDEDRFYFKKTVDLTSPISYYDFKDAQELSDFNFIKNPNGSLFKLSEKEYHYIMQLIKEKNDMQFSTNYNNLYSEKLLSSKNIILRGAPGTGKSYLAKQVAADIISKGEHQSFDKLTDDQKKQVEFVQFHPSYDYSDFVEGLRPKMNDDGSMGFELKDGIFKQFIKKARKNYEDFQKSEAVVKKELAVQEAIDDFVEQNDNRSTSYKTLNGSEFYISDIKDNNIYVSIPTNKISNVQVVKISDLSLMLESDLDFKRVKDVTAFFNKQHATQAFSYYLALYTELKKHLKAQKRVEAASKELKEYIFIIDEINRGDISKIFGELFYSIDPGYRGRAGEIATQYANLHDNPSEKFYIPENVYIIGTMNDIDRSVDSFDFAMHRRFRFLEIKAKDQIGMLDSLGNETLKDEAIERMTALNQAIEAVEELNSHYHVGPSYFLKLRELDFDQLWMDYLEPLLQEYVNGMFDESELMETFCTAYQNNDGDDDEII